MKGVLAHVGTRSDKVFLYPCPYTVGLHDIREIPTAAKRWLIQSEWWMLHFHQMRSVPSPR